MNVVKFFNLIRWKNLMLIAIMQLFTYIFLLSNTSFETPLTTILFYLLIVTTLLITASGYIINDIIDVKGDLINKYHKTIITKDISISNALKIYKIFISLGILIGSYIAFKIDKPLYTLLFIGISVLLYYYSKILKGTLIIGNLAVSLLLAFSMIIILIFHDPQILNPVESELYIKIQLIIVIYAVFSFLLNLIREIIKDIEDVNGDYHQNYKTLPIIIGQKRARNCVISISIITLLLMFIIILNLIDYFTLSFFYGLIFIMIPFIYFISKLWYAETLNNYKYLSKLLKIIILLGIISIPIISIYI